MNTFENIDEKTPSTHWLFMLNNDSTYGTTTDNFKNAILELANYTGSSSHLFQKCIYEFSHDDIDGLIDLFNHFSCYKIIQIYDVKKKLWADS